ncbi:hypothetical protein M5K25_016204 [Dendrobium thyrsiflorum]|uniref:Uncharacterized protein n=1 Tax=Dendrobium thyrsiflorum TaxID=117978 RepID=A0ABD0UJ66_DENTH
MSVVGSSVDLLSSAISDLISVDKTPPSGSFYQMISAPIFGRPVRNTSMTFSKSTAKRSAQNNFSPLRGALSLPRGHIASERRSNSDFVLHLHCHSRVPPSRAASREFRLLRNCNPTLNRSKPPAKFLYPAPVPARNQAHTIPLDAGLGGDSSDGTPFLDSVLKDLLEIIKCYLSNWYQSKSWDYCGADF